jgi:hypothetical protein
LRKAHEARHLNNLPTNDDLRLQASDVEAAIKGMLDGTLNPEDIKIEGIDTPAEAAAKEVSKRPYSEIMSCVTMFRVYMFVG